MDRSLRVALGACVAGLEARVTRGRRSRRISLFAAAGAGARRVDPFDGRIAEEKRGQKLRFRREGRIWPRSLPRNGART